MRIGIIGIGCVGYAILQDFTDKGIDVIIYDKYKDTYNKNLEDILITDIIFICLPTPYNLNSKQYDKSSIYDTCNYLKLNNFKGLVVLKSTVEPETTENIAINTGLKIVHNPEFLTASTSIIDFKNQNHIVLGYPKFFNKIILNKLISFYNLYYPKADISIVTSTESELMKISLNSFYAIKIQFFNEIYAISNKIDIDYDTVKNTMLKNNWINPMHTQIPGTDGRLSYGGMCFPKDTNALYQYMVRKNSINKVLKSTIKERNQMRKNDL